MKKVLGIILLATMCASCSCLNSLFSNPIMEIELGMTRDQVINILGNPSLRSINEDYEELGFTINYAANDYIKVVNVQFVDGKVVSMDSYPLPKRPEVKAE